MWRLGWLILLVLASASALAQRPRMWRMEELANSPVDSVATQRARLILQVKARLEAAAGVAAELFLVEGNQPNAFSAPSSRSGPIVGLNLGMVELLGDDEDAYAAVLGHEYAHLTLRHREARMGRESARILGSTALAIALGAQRMNRGAADVASFATQVVSTSFSREEERAADTTGLGYAAAAGYDPYGAVRLWERMAAGGERTVRFLSSHPASAERVESMRALAATLAPTEVQYVWGGVKIHSVLFVEADSSVVVSEMPQGVRSTLKLGDRLVGCYGAAPRHMTLRTLAACRSPDGGYAFLVERDAGQVAAVVLPPAVRY